MKRKNRGTLSFLPPLFAASAYRGRAARAEPTLLFRQQPLGLAVGTESRGNCSAESFPRVCDERLKYTAAVPVLTSCPSFLCTRFLSHHRVALTARWNSRGFHMISLISRSPLTFQGPRLSLPSSARPREIAQ